MNKAVLSYKYPQFASALSKLGYETIESESVDIFIEYEQDHADMQCLIIDDTAFILNRCKRLANKLKSDYKTVLCSDDIGRNYPKNVALNAAVVGKNVICRSLSIDKKVFEYFTANKYSIINVNQGYSKCSCAIAGDNAVITADKGIYRSVKSSGKDIDILLIGEDRIQLSDSANGFIGGASGYDARTKTLYFCGDIRKHSDYRNIKNFCKSHGTKIKSLSDSELTDIGGIVFC